MRRTAEGRRFECGSEKPLLERLVGPAIVTSMGAEFSRRVESSRLASENSIRG